MAVSRSLAGMGHCRYGDGSSHRAKAKDMERKKNAIFKHQSQKDSAMFPGNDEREFWQRAEQRNKETAAKYNDLGMAEYEAMEGFVRYHFM